MSPSQELAVPDAVTGNWVDSRAPLWLQPYLRLARIDRPIGWWLLLLPCWWSTALAADVAGKPYPDPLLLILFWLGSVAMRGAGSTYNDIVDRDLDRKVERTRNRPMASGAVSVKAGLLFCLMQCLIGLGVLFSLNGFSVLLGVCSVIPVLAYPFMKRITSWPQAVLGLAFSWGALMGWAAVFGRLDWPPMLLYYAAIVWTMGYDTIYAIQDIEDDALAGIGSTALMFGARTPVAVGGFYSMAVLLVLSAFWTAGVGAFAHGGLAVFAVHLGWQVNRIDVSDGHSALKLFRSNRNAGLILFAGLALDAAVRHFGG
jgi:4-hydroxybenzoate polyprenyltransferase